MSSPIVISESNQYSALATPTTAEAKSWESKQSSKDDQKQQAHQAREGVKGKAVPLQEQVMSQIGKGIELAKSKVASMTGDASVATASNEELLNKASDAAEGEWETVKHRGHKAIKHGEKQLDENLTPQQKAQLAKAAKSVKRTQAKAEGLFASVFSAPQLRPARRFIERNNLQLPVMILGVIFSLWISLSLIRIITTAATPRVPEFDIHSAENSANWLKWHAGEYKNRAVDLKDSLSSRAAAFLANHDQDFSKMQAQAVDWKDIGLKRLGLAEPTWTESAMAWLTGRPTTWQGRVESVLDLTKQGLKAAAIKKGLKAGVESVRDSAKDSLGIHEPTLMERASNFVTGHTADPTLQERVQQQASNIGGGIGGVVDSIRASMHKTPEPAPVAEGIVDSIKHKIVDGVNSVRAHLPGSAAAAAELEAARQRAYDATHHSTLDNIKSGAEYIKNRVIHGAEEATHIAHDRANKAMDEAKYKAGL
jgi:ElaB/YqjD/DUF883 family membrane-anchored ribosome-binding protein